MRNLCVLLSVSSLLIVGFPLSSMALESAETAKKEKLAKVDKSVRITADRIRHQKGTSESNAEGAVEIRWKGKVITGDIGGYNSTTHAGFMEGNVHFVDAESDMYAERVEFVADGEAGVLFNARGKAVGDTYITGEKVERLSEEHYLIDDGSYTSCNQENPHWAFHASHTDLTIEEYAYMQHMVFKVGPIPILYTPRFVVPVNTKRSTGFLRPLVGASSKYGMEVENAFFWAMADNADATITHKHLGSAGDEANAEIRYLFAEGATQGQIKARYLHDTDPDRTEDRDLWKVEADHQMTLPFKVRNRVHLDMENENAIDRQYGDSTLERTRRYSDSFVDFNRSFDTRSLNLTVRQRKSTQQGNEDTYDTLPTLVFNNQKEALFGSSFYGKLDSSYTAYNSSSTPVVGERVSYGVERVDFSPTLSLPLPLAPWLSIEPQLKFRTTWYSNGLDEEGNELNESYSREFYTASVNVSGPKFNRIFLTDSAWRPKVKHIIYPTFGWAYTPGLEFDGEDRLKPRIFDSIDSDGRGGNHNISYGLVNQILAKEIISDEESKTLSLMQLSIQQAYDLNKASDSEVADEDREPFGPIKVDLRTRFFDGLLLNYEASYDYYEEFWEKSRFELAIRHENIFHLALDRSYTWGRGNDDSVWDTAYLEVNTPWKIGLEYSIIYNEAKQEVNDSLFRAKYLEDCWMFALNLRNRKINSTNNAGESFIEDESIITFSITLQNVGDILGLAPKAIAGRKI